MDDKQLARLRAHRRTALDFHDALLFAGRCTDIAAEAIWSARRYSGATDLTAVDEREMFYALAFGRLGIARYVLGLNRLSFARPRHVRVTLAGIREDFADFANDTEAGMRGGRVLGLAWREARRRKAGLVDSSDLLVGFAADTPGVVARILQRYELDVAAVRRKVQEWQDEEVESSWQLPASELDKPLDWYDR